MEPVKPDTPRYERFGEDLITPPLTPILESNDEKEIEWGDQLALMESRAKEESAARKADERRRQAELKRILDEKKHRLEERIKRDRARSA